MQSRVTNLRLAAELAPILGEKPVPPGGHSSQVHFPHFPFRQPDRIAQTHVQCTFDQVDFNLRTCFHFEGNTFSNLKNSSRPIALILILREIHFENLWILSGLSAFILDPPCKSLLCQIIPLSCKCINFTFINEFEFLYIYKNGLLHFQDKAIQ